jgi:hypothetical protein
MNYIYNITIPIYRSGKIETKRPFSELIKTANQQSQCQIWYDLSIKKSIVEPIWIGNKEIKGKSLKRNSFQIRIVFNDKIK